MPDETEIEKQKTGKTITLYMAPLKGVTDHVFRNTFVKYFEGFDLAVAPFIGEVKSRKIRRKYVRDLLPENNTAMPVVPQILGQSAEGFIHLANYLFDHGYDTVNWNLGCPFPLNPKNKRGSHLLPHTDRIRGFLEKVIPVIKSRLSIKTRLGQFRKDEIFRLLRVLNDFPIEEIIVHPRTGLQRYEGVPDFNAFESCITRTVHPLAYNGDINSVEDFRKLAARFAGISRWMIGRPAIVNPLLPGIIKNGVCGSENSLIRMKAFHDDLYSQYRSRLYSPRHVLDRMKGLWRYMGQAFHDGGKIMATIKESVDLDQYAGRVDELFQKGQSFSETGSPCYKRDDLKDRVLWSSGINGK